MLAAKECTEQAKYIQAAVAPSARDREQLTETAGELHCGVYCIETYNAANISAVRIAAFCSHCVHAMTAPTESLVSNWPEASEGAGDCEDTHDRHVVGELSEIKRVPWPEELAVFP